MSAIFKYMKELSLFLNSICWFNLSLKVNFLQ